MISDTQSIHLSCHAAVAVLYNDKTELGNVGDTRLLIN